MSKKTPEQINEERLEASYNKTGYCPSCGIKLPIDSKSGCNNLICKGGN